MIPEKPQHNNVVLVVYTLGETLFFVRYLQCVIFLNEKKADAFCCFGFIEGVCVQPVSYTHLRAHETRHDLVCRLLLEKKKKKNMM